VNTMTVAELQPHTKLTLAEWCQLLGVGGDQDRVLTIAQWAAEIGISMRTARDLLASGNGPPVVELSPNRVGIRVCDHRAWLAERTKRHQGSLRR
jgi:predicted DNA-binding transcriptional regulator AlpA